jgi:hypothetical protein
VVIRRGRGLKLTTHVHPMPRPRMRIQGAVLRYRDGFVLSQLLHAAFENRLERYDP